MDFNGNIIVRFSNDHGTRWPTGFGIVSHWLEKLVSDFLRQSLQHSNHSHIVTFDSCVMTVT